MSKPSKGYNIPKEKYKKISVGQALVVSYLKKYGTLGNKNNVMNNSIRTRDLEQRILSAESMIASHVGSSFDSDEVKTYTSMINEARKAFASTRAKEYNEAYKNLRELSTKQEFKEYVDFVDKNDPQEAAKIGNGFRLIRIERERLGALSARVERIKNIFNRI